MNNLRADDVRIACPLFQAESGGEVPTSALQLIIYSCSIETFSKLNSLWHSRMPFIGGFYGNGMFFTAQFNGVYYATAGWSDPVNLQFNGKGVLELRRFAIAPDAPKYSASRLLSIMVRIIKRQRPATTKLISYQDIAAHLGTIYKAQGWTVTEKASTHSGWINRGYEKGRGRARRVPQSTTPKIRWELDL